ncbi:hypothetical protein HanPI659440_Chr04g0170031 [Helianthus annuus]|nr:hypothetical protein HanPI659440_Chr04g0170031 [Helianthus annuus]
MDVLQMSVAGLLTMGESSVGILDELRRSLEIRLMSALAKKEEAEKVNLNMEVCARNALAYEERKMEKEVQESEKLKREAAKNSKMHEFLTQHGREVKILREEITCKCRAVNQLKVMFDYPIVQNDILSSSQTPCEPCCCAWFFYWVFKLYGLCLGLVLVLVLVCIWWTTS